MNIKSLFNNCVIEFDRRRPCGVKKTESRIAVRIEIGFMNIPFRSPLIYGSIIVPFAFLIKRDEFLKKATVIRSLYESRNLSGIRMRNSERVIAPIRNFSILQFEGIALVSSYK